MTHVLIVEDHEENRNLLKMLLEANRYRVTAAGDGQEALDAARRDPPDAIISDVHMPTLDGFALCRAWTQDPGLRAIPFIFYSATNVRPEDEEFGLTLGAARYLIKPLEAELLLAELRAVLQSRTGPAAPAPAPPLDDVVFHTLHELALARKIEDKVAQLEAANRKLQESEARFRSLTEISSDFYWESDAEHRLTRRVGAGMSRAVSMFRRPTQIGERRWEIPSLSPDDAGWAAHRRELETHKPFRDFEFSRMGVDGAEHFISISGDPVFDASGAFIGYRGVGIDITERKRGEEALRRFGMAMDAIADAIYLVDRTSMRFVHINDAACRMRKQTREEMFALGPEGVGSTSRAELERIYDTVIARGGVAEPLEMLRTRPDGSKVWVELRRHAQCAGDRWTIVTMVRDITERKKSEQGLTLFRALIDQSSDAIEVIDPETFRFLDVNQKGCLDLGYSREELLSLTVFDIDPTYDRSTRITRIQDLKKSGSNVMESRHRRKDGSEFPVEISLRYIQLDRDYVLSTARDITDRKIAEARVHRLTQLYAALSQCNEAIVRCTREEELFPRICRAAVQFGGMKMAWIGMVDPDTRRVRPAASFGDRADEYLQGIELSADADSAVGHGLTGTAIRENQPIWCQDFQNDPRATPWHKHGARFDWGAAASLPLHRHGIPVGVLMLYASELGAFDEAARQLLAEMATDIDFALDNFAREAAREQAQKDLRAAEEQFRGLVEQSIAGIYVIQDEKFAYVNPRFAEIFGYASADELIGRDSPSLVAERDRSVAIDHRRRIEEEAQSMSYSFTGVRKDGGLIEVGVHGTRATHKGRPAVIGLLQDISEKTRAEEQIQRYLKQLQTAFMSTVEVATSLSEMRDPYTAGHERRVGTFAAAIGAELGFDDQRIEGLRVAGFLHDIGKITIPAEILSKPGKLNAIEYQLIQGHPQSSYDVLKDVEFPWPVAEVALQHHERMDGSGYPQGLKGGAILLEARIMAVADVVEAMSSHRPYRPGLGIDKALAEIERGRGTAYDTEVADACLRLFREKVYQLPP